MTPDEINNLSSRKSPVDTQQWFGDIAAELVQLGYEASADHTGGCIICVVVNVGKYSLYFGTANENWGFDVYDLGGEFNEDLSNEYSINPAMQMTLPTTEENPITIAQAIAAAVDIFKKDREEVERGL